MIHRALALLRSPLLVVLPLLVVFTLPIDAGAASILFEGSGADASEFKRPSTPSAPHSGIPTMEMPRDRFRAEGARSTGTVAG